MTTFIGWMAFLVVVIVGFFLSTKRSRRIEEQSEDVASTALPEIGKIAEHQHTLRFGRPPTETPGPPGTSVWYPPLKKKHTRA